MRRTLQITMLVLSFVVPFLLGVMNLINGAGQFLPPDAIFPEIDNQLRVLLGLVHVPLLHHDLDRAEPRYRGACADDLFWDDGAWRVCTALFHGGCRDARAWNDSVPPRLRSRRFSLFRGIGPWFGAPAAWPLRKRWPYIVVVLTVAINSLGIGLILPVMPNLLLEMGLPDLSEAAAIGGMLSLVFAAMQFLFAPLLGRLSDRYGRRVVLITSLVAVGIDYLLLAVASSLWLFFVARIISGDRVRHLFCGERPSLQI